MTKRYSKKALAKKRNAVTRKRLGGKTRKMRGVRLILEQKNQDGNQD